MSWFLFVSVLAAVLTLLLSLSVLLNNYRSQINRRYFAFGLMAAFWILSTSMSVILTDPVQNEIATRLITPTSLLTFYAFVLLALTFPFRLNSVDKTLMQWLALPVILISATAFTDLNVRQIATSSGFSYEFGALYLPYVILILGMAGLGLYWLIKKQRQATGLYKLQLNAVMFGLVLTIVPAILVGLILPLVGVESVWNYTHFFIVPFLVSSGFAIIKHRLFDLRWLTTRLAAYVLTLLPLMLLAALLVASLSYYLLDNLPTLNDAVIAALVAVILMLALGPLKKWFDRLTFNVFYRDSYELDTALDELGVRLTSSESLAELKKTSVKVIKSYLKPLFVDLHVHKKGRWTLAGQSSKLSAKQIDYLWRQAKYPIVQSQLKPNRLHGFMREQGIEVIIRLKTYNKQIGLLLLGSKRDGDTYSPQDIQFLEIGSKNIAIAISNALRFEEIADFNRRLMAEIAAATEKLSRANTRLRKLDKTKDAFISAASHQLRPQLTAAQGFLSLLKDDININLNTEQRQNLNYLKQSLERMVHIVEDLLDSAVMLPSKVKLKRRPVQLADIVRAEVKNVGWKKAQPIRLRLETKLPLLSLDVAKIQEVIANLIENAHQYSRGQGVVEIRLWRSGQVIELSVTDQGIGIGQASQAKLFEKFFRTSQARRVRPEGTGIGLYVARTYIEAHGGKMTVESTAGKGATIGFRLPLT